MSLDKAALGEARGSKQTAGTHPPQGKSRRMKVTNVRKGMRDGVAMPRVETRWENAALQANALKLEKLPKEPA